jgi:hypothetical protein
MTETIGKLTTLKLTSTNLECESATWVIVKRLNAPSDMLPVLTKAVGAFTSASPIGKD